MSEKTKELKTSKPPRITLKQKFLKENDGKEMTTAEIYDWYLRNKEDPLVLPDRSAPHRLIIDPLIHNDRITRRGKGLYIISPAPILDESLGAVGAVEDGEDSEEIGFDEYIASKLK